ncbi:DUF3150 domain-containing protein [Vibrio pomeroyi]|uniref:DUF3150 domain-containing protein n=1 Tax=Vibrio pomeroyi TaxID=198832 RepID=A0ABV4MQS2_9VIBR|nr:DUF3150 domain-containing protein [Vibrio atlanticus]MCZ4310975.1 DUF3150 domain-containing protein [Vibrio atlanticus]
MTLNTNANATAPNAQAEQAAIATQEMLQQHEQLKDGCSIVGYEIRNWSGKKTFSEGKVTALDTSGKDVELPTDLVSPGRKSLLDTRTHLSFCNKFSSRMSRLFNKYGVRFLGNYLVADALLPELLKEAESDIATYEKEVHAFCGKYEQLIAEWCAKHPGLESVIRDGYMTVEEVRARFRLRVYKPIRFSTRQEEDLAEIVGEASAQLFEDIAKEAQGLLKESLTIKDGAAKGSWKEECTQDIKRPIRRLRDKVFSLYMLDPVFEGVVDVFDNLLEKALPDTGKIRGSHFSNLMAHVMMMTDAHKLKLHASGINQIAAKVAEVEQVEENVEQAETVADTASETGSELEMQEAELLKQLAAIRQQQTEQTVEKPTVTVKQPETQPTVEIPSIEEQSASIMVEIPVSAEATIEVQQDVVHDEPLLAEPEISVDISSLEDLDSVIPVETAEPLNVTTSGFFF